MGTNMKFDSVSTRQGFNSVVKHVKATVSYVGAVAAKTNLADVLAEDMDSLDDERIAAIVRMTLVDKYGYVSASRNLQSVSTDLEAVSAEIAKWNAVDLVIAYHHQDMGLLLANPKNADQLNAFGSLRKRELAVAYVGRFDAPATDICDKALACALSLLEGAKVSIPQALYDGPCKYKVAKKKEAAVPKAKKVAVKAPKMGKAAKAGAAEPAPAPVAAVVVQTPAPLPAAVPGKGVRMTPMYSVVVRNELFHNGNVEAWKRIIGSYRTKYPLLDVIVYYDGERIQDLNSLFKWGKVKHGSTIQFAVAGNEIKDVAKLQRYLNQGASHLFEAFLRGPVNTPLKLF